MIEWNSFVNSVTLLHFNSTFTHAVSSCWSAINYNEMNTVLISMINLLKDFVISLLVPLHGCLFFVKFYILMSFHFNKIPIFCCCWLFLYHIYANINLQADKENFAKRRNYARFISRFEDRGQFAIKENE